MDPWSPLRSPRGSRPRSLSRHRPSGPAHGVTTGSPARPPNADGSGILTRMNAASESLPDYRVLGLSDFEFGLLVEGLGRVPGGVELAMLSLMWSEHCAYKHSKRLLRRFPVVGEFVLVGPGENAGAVDVGGGLAVAFKVESHNHPVRLSRLRVRRPVLAGFCGMCLRLVRVRSRCLTVSGLVRWGCRSVQGFCWNMRLLGSGITAIRSVFRRLVVRSISNPVMSAIV